MTKPQAEGGFHHQGTKTQRGKVLIVRRLRGLTQISGVYLRISKNLRPAFWPGARFRFTVRFTVVAAWEELSLCIEITQICYLTQGKNAEIISFCENTLKISVKIQVPASNFCVF